MRFIVDDAGSLIDMETGKVYDYFEDVVDLINQQEIDKLNYKKELNNLKYKIKKLVGD